jgi:hypothetical protein
MFRRKWVIADSKGDLSRALWKPAVTRKVIKENPLRQGHSNNELARSEDENHQRDFFTGATDGPWLAESVDNPKLWTRCVQLSCLQDHQIDLFEHGQESVTHG